MKRTSPFLHFFLCAHVCQHQYLSFWPASSSSHFLHRLHATATPLPDQTGLPLPLSTAYPLLPHSFLQSRPLAETLDSFPKPKPSRPGSSPRDLDDLKTMPLSTALNPLPQPCLILWVHTIGKYCHSHRMKIGTKSKDGGSHVPWGQAHRPQTQILQLLS